MTGNLGIPRQFLASGTVLAISACNLLPLVNQPPTPPPGTGTQALDGTTQTTPLDGVTQSTPLVIGVVADAAGKPVAGATVVAYVGRQVAAAGNPSDLSATTDASGKFSFKEPPAGEVTFEASKGPNKAIKLSIPVIKGVRELDLGTLALAAPGALRGKVVVPQGESALGIDVYVPGTRFVAKTDAEGRYTLDGLALASYRIVATKERYATAVSEPAAVEAGKTSDVPDLVLTLDAPTVSSLSASFGAYGQEIVIKGTGFGKSRSLPVDVAFGSVRAATLERISDTEIRAGVPYNAVNAPVTVVVNGVASAGSDFRVVRKVLLSSALYETKIGEPKNLAVQVLDSTGQAVESASPTYAVSPQALGTVSAGSFVPGTTPGTGSVRVSLGEVAAESSLYTSRFWVERLVSGLPSSPTGLALLGELLHLATGATVSRFESGSVASVVGETPVDNLSGTSAANFAVTAEADVESDAQGNLYIADTGLKHIHVLPAADGQKFGIAMLKGNVYKISGAVSPKIRSLQGLAVRADGAVAFCDNDPTRNNVRILYPDGTSGLLLGAADGSATDTDDTSGIATGSAGLSAPISVAFDQADNLFVGDNSRLWMVPAADGTYFGRQLTGGKAYVLAGTGDSTFNADGPAKAVNLFLVGGILPDGDSLLISVTNHQVLRSLGSDGKIRTLLGRGPDQVTQRMIGTRARFTSLGDIEWGPSGSLFLSEPANQVVLKLD